MSVSCNLSSPASKNINSPVAHFQFWLQYIWRCVLDNISVGLLFVLNKGSLNTGASYIIVWSSLLPVLTAGFRTSPSSATNITTLKKNASIRIQGLTFICSLKHTHYFHETVLCIEEWHASKPASHVCWLGPLAAVSGFAIPTVHIIAARRKRENNQLRKTSVTIAQGS